MPQTPVNPESQPLHPLGDTMIVRFEALRDPQLKPSPL